MPKVTDPDNLNQGTEIHFDVSTTTARTIGISSSNDVAGSNIASNESGSDSGVGGQALYSFCKEEWKSDATLIKIPFPLVSITENQFDLQNNWNFFDDVSRYLIRDAGWSVISSSVGDSSVTTEEWIGVQTLGTLGFDGTAAGSDQVYYQQSGSFEAGTDAASIANTAINFNMSGAINQAIMHFSQSHTAVERNFRSFTKVFVREYKKTYDDATIQDDLGVPTQKYTLYSIPLQNATDVKINTSTEADAADPIGPYENVYIYYFTGSGYQASGSFASPYDAGLVVSGSDGQWYIDNDGGADAGGAPGGDWEPYAYLTPEGTGISASAQISASGEWHVFNVVIANGTGSAAQTGSIEDVYTRVQYELRLSTDIDDASGEMYAANTFIGKTSDLLLSFVGDTLVTSNGVLLLNQQDADTNSIDFYDVSGSVVRFPFVATGVISFNDNLQAEPTDSGSYFMFFTDLTAEGGTGTFGQTDAVLVEDDDGNPITGSVDGLASVSFTFDYDGNIQGGRTSAQDAAVTVVAIGLGSAQYVVATSTIGRNKSNNISLVAALERNYLNP